MGQQRLLRTAVMCQCRQKHQHSMPRVLSCALYPSQSMQRQHAWSNLGRTAGRNTKHEGMKAHLVVDDVEGGGHKARILGSPGRISHPRGPKGVAVHGPAQVSRVGVRGCSGHEALGSQLCQCSPQGVPCQQRLL